MADKLPPAYIGANQSYLVPQDAILDRVLVNLGENPGNGFLLTTGSGTNPNPSTAMVNLPSYAVTQVDSPMMIDVRTPVLAGQKIFCVYAGAQLFFS